MDEINEQKFEIYEYINDHQIPIQLFMEQLSNENYDCIIPGSPSDDGIMKIYEKRGKVTEINTREKTYYDLLTEASNSAINDYYKAETDFEKTEFSKFMHITSFFAPIMSLISDEYLPKTCLLKCSEDEIDYDSLYMGISRHKYKEGAVCLVKEENIVDTIKSIYYESDPYRLDKKMKYFDHVAGL